MDDFKNKRHKATKPLTLHVEASRLVNASAGPNQLAIAYSGEELVRAAFAKADIAPQLSLNCLKRSYL